jgi:hypothetical protein
MVRGLAGRDEQGRQGCHQHGDNPDGNNGFQENETTVASGLTADAGIGSGGEWALRATADSSQGAADGRLPLPTYGGFHVSPIGCPWFDLNLAQSSSPWSIREFLN